MLDYAMAYVAHLLGPPLLLLRLVWSQDCLPSLLFLNGSCDCLSSQPPMQFTWAKEACCLIIPYFMHLKIVFTLATFCFSKILVIFTFQCTHLFHLFNLLCLKLEWEGVTYGKKFHLFQGAWSALPLFQVCLLLRTNSCRNSRQNQRISLAHADAG
jgi:hypothetical protein